MIWQAILIRIHNGIIKPGGGGGGGLPWKIFIFLLF